MCCRDACGHLACAYLGAAAWRSLWCVLCCGADGRGCGLGSGCSTGAFAALNARKLSAAALAVVQDTTNKVLVLVHESACCVLRLGQTAVLWVRVCARGVQGGCVMAVGAGKGALVHTYRTPRYIGCAYRGAWSGLGWCGSSIKTAATTDYVALVSDVGHLEELQSQEAMPVFVFAAHVVLRVGNEGPLPPLREAYCHAVTWADKLVEALLPAPGPAPAQRAPASLVQPTTGRVLVKTVSRTTMAVGRTAAASPGAACRMASGMVGAGVRRVLSFTPAAARKAPTTSSSPAKNESPSTRLVLSASPDVSPYSLSEVLDPYPCFLYRLLCRLLCRLCLQRAGEPSTRAWARPRV